MVNGRLVLGAALLGGLLALSCSRSRPCPDGMNLVSDRSTIGKEIWCRSSDGKRARWMQFYREKEPRVSCAFFEGRPEGSFTAWHDGGKPWLEGLYRDGTKGGTWTQWDKNGLKVASGEYRRGDLVGGAPVGIPATCEQLKP